MGNWILYVLMILLIITNIALIILFIIKVPRSVSEERDVRRNKIEIAETSADKAKKKPTTEISNQQTLYYILESQNKKGWQICKRGAKEPIAFAKTKNEAQEVMNNLYKN